MTKDYLEDYVSGVEYFSHWCKNFWMYSFIFLMCATLNILAVLFIVEKSGQLISTIINGEFNQRIGNNVFEIAVFVFFFLPTYITITFIVPIVFANVLKKTILDQRRLSELREESSLPKNNE